MQHRWEALAISQDAAHGEPPSRCVHLLANVVGGGGEGWGEIFRSTPPPHSPQGLFSGLFNQGHPWLCKWASFQPGPGRPLMQAGTSGRGGPSWGGGPLCGWGQGQGRHGESQLVPPPLCLDWMRSDSRLGHSAVGASLTLCGNPDLKDPWASPGMRFFISLIPSSGHSAWGRGTHWLRASPGCSRSLATFGEEMKSGKTHRSERELVHIKHLPCSRHCVQHFKCADPSSL